MKSSAPILRPNSSSISSSLEVRKITGRSDFWRSRRRSSMPSMRGILMSKIARCGGRATKAVERGGAVRIGLDPIAFGFERDRNRGQNVAVVVHKRDCLHPVAPLHERVSLPALQAAGVDAVRQLGIKVEQIVAKTAAACHCAGRRAHRQDAVLNRMMARISHLTDLKNRTFI